MTKLPLLAMLTLSAGCLVGSAADSAPEEAAPDEVLVDTPDGEDPKLLPPGKIAVLLVHGFSGSAESFDPSIVNAITAGGHVVGRAQVPAIESVAVRAAALGPQIDQMLALTGAAKVHIVAHSMGGLDARKAISSLGYAAKVASLTTISTPHKGTPLADLALGITSSSLVDQEDAYEAVLEIVGLDVDIEALNRALLDLSEAQAATFNAATPDAAGVRYFSYAGFSTPKAIDNPNAPTACAAPGAAMPTPDEMRGSLILAAPIVARGTERHPNDGVVSVASATWTGFAGCISADHLDETDPQTAAFYGTLAGKLAAL